MLSQTDHSLTSLQIMRSNQKRLAQSLANPGQSDTRDIKRALAVVPFRHSKLTEILMDYFAGDGRIVRFSFPTWSITNFSCAA